MSEDIPSISSAHLTDADVENYRNRNLSSEAILTLCEHLALCGSCRDRLSVALSIEDSVSRLIASVQRPLEVGDEHLDEETLIAYSEKQLSPIKREMVEGHLDICASCRFQANELSALYSLMASSPTVIYEPSLPPSLWQRLLSWVQVPTVRQTLQMSSVALAAGLLVFIFLKRPPATSSSGDRNAAREQALTSKESEIAHREGELNQQLANLDQSKKQVSADQGKIRNEKAAITRQKKDVEHERKLLAQTQQPVFCQLPAPVQLAYNFPEAGVHITMFQGSAQKQDALPFALLTPLPGEVVRPEGLTFQWEKYANAPGQSAASYMVELESDGKFLKSGVLTQTEWTPTPPLEPGKLYSWKVFAYSAEPARKMIAQSPLRGVQIRFRTLTKDDIAQLHEARGSILRLGTTFAKIGMWQEAEQAFKIYLRAAPNDIPAQEWFRRIQQRRRTWLRKAEEQLDQIPGSRGANEMRKQLNVEPIER